MRPPSPQRPPAWRRYLRFWGADLARDVDEELRFHYEMRRAEYVARGHSPADAERLARQRLGDLQHARDACVDIDSRYAKRESWLDLVRALRQDAVFASRILRRQFGAALTAALCIAVGIGATTTMFSITDAALLHPLPYPTGDRLMVIGASREGDHHSGVTSYLEYRDWAARQHSFSSVAAVGQTDLTVIRTDAERVSGALLSASLPRTLGITPEAGRFFDETEDRPGAPLVIVVSRGFAEREFGGMTRALGQTLIVSGMRRTIIGIVRDRWRYPSRADIWVPLARDPARENRGNRNLVVLGALRPNVSVDDARRDFRAIAHSLAIEYPLTDKSYTALVTPMRDSIVGDARGSLVAMMIAALLVLVVACANVAALQLARAAARTREFAVRAAIGGARGRLIRQLLTESVALALLGGIAGTVLAYAVLHVVTLALLPRTPAWMHVVLDWRSLCFALAVSMITGIVFGVAPALNLAGTSPADTLRTGTVTGGRTRLQRAFVATEIAMSIVLVVGATFALQSVRAVARIPLGFDPHGVLTFRIVMQDHEYDDPPRRAQFVTAIEEALQALPGVTSVGAATLPPVDGCCSQFTAHIEGQPDTQGATAPAITGTIVTPGYFRTMGISLVRGRGFTAHDDASAPPVTIINETFAQRYWPRGDALGHHVNTGAGNAEIIGIVPDIKQTSLLDTPEPQFYRPYAADPWTNMTVALHVARGDPASLASAVRQAVHKLDPSMPVFNVRTMDAVVEDARSASRTFGMLLTAFAIVALLLAAAGVYAVTSFLVAQRTRELGVRVALGAEPMRVAGMVLREGVVLALIGVVVGLGGALATARVLESMLYGVSTTEPLVFVEAALVLGLTAALASYAPARRASRVDPMEAMRSE
jgi:putative ABC transport system permease protein